MIWLILGQFANMLARQVFMDWIVTHMKDSLIASKSGINNVCLAEPISLARHPRLSAGEGELGRLREATHYAV